MKNEVEFRSYLTSVRVSSKTGLPYTPKVVTDILRRVRIAETLLSIEISAASVGMKANLEKVCKRLRDERMGSTPTTPYLHLSLISSVRIYSDFVEWRRGQ